jgi:outer membrane protein assembly factor BamB
MNPAPRLRSAPRGLLAAAAIVIAACDTDGSAVVWRTLGELPAPAATALNHTPLVVSGGRVLVGTGDGLWARPLDGGGDWTRAGLAGVGVFATRTQPGRDATIFAAGMPAADPAAAPFYRSDDAGMNWTGATTFPRNPFDASSEPFYDLAVAPDDSERIYANLSGPSVAISTDGGMNWALANGESEVFFGDPCVIHVLESAPGLLYQGCEAPLDNAWVASQVIDPADPLTLADFTFVAGGPDFALENRRPNAMASGPARPGTLYVGLEGALIALDADGFEFAFRSEDGASELPYIYVSAIWADPDDEDHLVFGGGVNGENTVFSLFETFDHGETLRRIRAPEALVDPAVEQLVPAGDEMLAVLVSHVDAPGDERRRLTLYLLETGGI